MNTVYLCRGTSTEQGTLSTIICPDNDFTCKAIELPWKDNIISYSCIPTGEYIVKRRWSKKYNYHYHITDVKGRSWILCHSGNFAGDTSKGWKTHSEGCILLGLYFGIITGQNAVLNSRTAIRRFEEAMNYETFKLIIL